MLCNLFYLPCELHPRKKVIVYVTFFRLNEANFDNCSQLELKNIMLKSKTQIVQCRKRKLNYRKSCIMIRNCSFRKKYEYFASYLMFREIPGFFYRKSQFSRDKQDIYKINPNFFFGKSGICTFVTIACHTYPGHFILPYDIRNRSTCLKGLEMYMQSVYGWHKNDMFF
jgi:hypothetical protein